MFNKLMKLKPSIEAYFLSDEYIDNVIKTQMWSSHGTGIFDDTDYLYDFEDQFGDTENNKDELKAYLKHWLPFRLRYIFNELEHELKNNTIIYRSMYLKEDAKVEVLNKIKKETTVESIGIYWSTTSNVSPFDCDMSTMKGGYEVLLSTPLIFESINWIETFRSRIDFINGDCEQEIQLNPPYNVLVNAVSVEKVDNLY